MTVLLTGAGGFLGQHLARALLEQGVRGLRLHARRPLAASRLAPLRAAFPHAGVDSAGANLLQAAALPALVAGCDTVVHAAAGMRGHPADMFANTVVASRNLFAAAAAAGVRRLVLVSSFSVYRTGGLARGARHDESLELEPVGIDKGPYAYAKLRQEQLLHEWAAGCGVETVVLRPGVIYGPGGGAFSSRVGIRALGLFFHLGGGATLPLTHVANCADAIALASLRAPAGSVFNVVDDELPTSRQYLRRYRREVARLRVLPVPYPLLLAGSGLLAAYHRRSRGQLPAVFTPRVVRSMYRPLRYSNAALHALGWTPRIGLDEGLAETFAWLREQSA